jgi:phi13 family phage major tail protein
MAKVFEYRGVRGLVAAEVIEDSTENFTTGTPFAVAGVSEIAKSTDSSNEAHYYDNQAAVVISSTSADEITINSSAIPFDTLAKITGQIYDAETGMYCETERTPKTYSIGYITKTTDAKEIFVWRLKGSFNIPGETNQTENDGTDANGQEITFTGISTTHKFEACDNKGAKSVYVDTSVNTDVDEQTFFASVQTPDDIKKN